MNNNPQVNCTSNSTRKADVEYAELENEICDKNEDVSCIPYTIKRKDTHSTETPLRTDNTEKRR